MKEQVWKVKHVKIDHL
ncbi:hypothetical protein VCHENC02_2719A, partial [Vibrio harveyi]